MTCPANDVICHLFDPLTQAFGAAHCSLIVDVLLDSGDRLGKVHVDLPNVIGAHGASEFHGEVRSLSVVVLALDELFIETEELLVLIKYLLVSLLSLLAVLC